MSVKRIRVTEDGEAVLDGVEIPSGRPDGIMYRVSRKLGEGGMGSAYLAARVGRSGVSLVVLKMLHPTIVYESGSTAALMTQKEAVALARLNERVPPTPFVVRLIDSGSVPVGYRGTTVNLPWLAIEYIHGGVEGTTLTERVEHSVRNSGVAFDPARAARAIECIGKGIAAVHEAGIIHRDLTPNNVLCCGFGDNEIFKIADFGIARPAGLAATFGGIILGTPGYAAPEQAALDERRMGPWTDVFGFAAIVYFLLTGEDYFPVASPMDALHIVREAKRRSVLEARALSPELRERESACLAIDEALARATAVRPQERPQTAETLSAVLLKWLRTDSRRSRVQEHRLKSAFGTDEQTEVSGWSWSVCQIPTDERVIRHVSWDADGRCLAASSRGLSFWNGTTWLDVPLEGLPNPQGIRFVQRTAPGRWLIGGDAATLAVYSTEGVSEVVRGPDEEESFSHASGKMDDLAVFVGSRPGEAPLLYGLFGRRWLKPVVLKKASFVSGLAQLDDERWLVTGRKSTGGAFAAIYSPLAWEATPLALPEARALLACAGMPDLGLGLAAGSEGLTVWVEGGAARSAVIAGKPDLSAAALSAGGRGWVAGAGRIWLGQAQPVAKWWPAWEHAEWTTPIVSLFADVGIVIGVTADAGIVEGMSLVVMARGMDRAGTR